MPTLSQVLDHKLVAIGDCCRDCFRCRGGITLQTLQEYQEAGAVAVGSAERWWIQRRKCRQVCQSIDCKGSRICSNRN